MSLSTKSQVTSDYNKPQTMQKSASLHTQREIGSVKNLREAKYYNPTNLIYPSHGAMAKAIRASGISVADYVYDSVEIEDIDAKTNEVKKARVNYNLNVLANAGTRQVKASIEIVDNKIVPQVEYFVDNIGKKYAFNKQGLEMFLKGGDEYIKKHETDSINSVPGSEPAVASVVFNQQFLRTSHDKDSKVYKVMAQLGRIAKDEEPADPKTDLNGMPLELDNPEVQEGGSGDIKKSDEDVSKDDFLVSFQGDVIITDQNENEIFRWKGVDFDNDELDKFNSKDIKFFAEKYKKLMDLGLIGKSQSKGIDSLPEPKLPGEEPEEIDALLEENDEKKKEPKKSKKK